MKVNGASESAAVYLTMLETHVAHDTRSFQRYVRYDKVNERKKQEYLRWRWEMKLPILIVSMKASPVPQANLVNSLLKIFPNNNVLIENHISTN